MNASSSALLVTDDPSLTAEVQRLAAAAGAHLTVAAEPEASRFSWTSAAVVLVGEDVLPDLAAVGPTRRDRVHVVTVRPPADTVFRDALDIGAESVVELPEAEPWLVETLADTADGSAHRGDVVGVVGGCGGAGATTFATALAVAAASERSRASGVPAVVLVDADPLGPGIERVVGLDEGHGTRWGSLLESAGRLGSRSLRAALPQRDGLAVLGWGPGSRSDLDPAVVREVLGAAARGSDLVVVDLPRYADPSVVEILRRCDSLVLVSPLELAAVASATRLLARGLPVLPQTQLVARGPSTALDPEDVAAALDLPLAAAMTDQRRLAESVDLGLGPLRARRGPLARAARETLARVTSAPAAVRHVRELQP
jgi:secretion/DNA translocation related CpaE-like protein